MYRWHRAARNTEVSTDLPSPVHLVDHYDHRGGRGEGVERIWEDLNASGPGPGRILLVDALGLWFARAQPWSISDFSENASLAWGGGTACSFAPRLCICKVVFVWGAPGKAADGVRERSRMDAARP